MEETWIVFYKVENGKLILMELSKDVVFSLDNSWKNQAPKKLLNGDDTTLGYTL